MTKKDILNGMSEEEFYKLYPTKELWEKANRKKIGGASGAPHDGQPTADQFFNYGSHALDAINIPFGHFAYGGGPIYPAKMGGPCMECGGNMYIQTGGIPGWNPATGVYSAPSMGAPGLTPEQLTAAGYTNTGAGNWQSSQEMGYRNYKQVYPGQPGWQGPPPQSNKPIIPNPIVTGKPADNTSANTSFSNPVQQVNSGNTKKAYPILGAHAEGGDVHDKPGGSNVGKKTFADGSKRTGPYVGTSGGAPKGSYPIPDIKHARAALSLAHHAPNPEGIKAAVYKKYPSLRKAEYGFNNAVNYGSFSPPMQEGGIYDQSNAGTYPTMDYGGLKSLIDAAAKQVRKAYGGDVTQQGGNQDFKQNYTNAFDNYVKKNTFNAMLDQEHENMLNQFQTPMAQDGRSTGPSREEMQAMIETKKQNQGFFSGLANQYAPSNYHKTMGLFGNLFPANIGYGYEFGKDDYKKLKEMSDQGQITGIQEKYGMLGKLMPRVFGPKSVTFGIMGPGSSQQSSQPGQNVGAGAYDNPLEGMSHGELFKDYNKGVTKPGMQHADFMPSNLKPGAYGPQQDDSFRFEDTTAPGKTSAPFVQAYGGNIYQQGGYQNPTAYPNNYLEVTMKRKMSGQDDLAKYAPAFFNNLAAGIENKHDFAETKRAQLALMTPGSDTGPFAAVPGTGRRMGDYDPNSGMFRPNQMVPVQFPGGMYGYSQMGGAYQNGGDFEEGEEADLSPEEIAELKAQGYQIEELD